MIKLLSKDDVSRIINLDRWSFNSRRIAADAWCSSAGRSRVEASSKIVWLKVEGLPLHLRSPALFRDLGDLCGGFLEFKEEGCTWNSVRLKVKHSSSIPQIILLRFKDESFPVSVSAEDGLLFDHGWQVGRSAVFVRRAESSEEVGTGKGAALSTRDKEGCQRNLSELGTCADGTSEDSNVVLQIPTGSKERGAATFGSDLESDKEVVIEKEGLQTTDIDESEKVSRGPSVSKTGWVARLSHKGEGLLGHSALALSGPDFGPNATVLVSAGEARVETPPTVVGSPIIVLPSQPRLQDSPSPSSTSLSIVEESLSRHLTPLVEEDDALLREEILDSDSTPDDNMEAVLKQVEDELVAETPTEGVFSGNDEAATSSDAAVVKLGLCIAERLGTELQGSRSEAKNMVVQIAEEVIAKRNKALTSSKQERELERIRIDGSFSDISGQRRGRGRRLETSSVPFNDC
ncbi:hypothetical protein LINGRAHAP2_LOCUS36431 [Linum grandiflorum]